MPGQALSRTTVVALAAVLAAGCAATGTNATESTATASVTEAPGDPAASTAPASGAPTTSAEPTGDGTTGSGSTGGGTKSNGGQPGSRPTTSAPKPAGPTIAYFRVAQKPSCPSGTNVKPVAGTPVVVEWKTSNVDSVALSVDGPGVYADNYAPTGSETLNFPCSGAESDVQKHTYLLTVRNAHGTQKKALVVTATVHEIKQVN
ncbi:hypothetical protein [Micromonospora sp. CB01531]|uniref:hypothetical protein n=1 Tax=Micromonospora sp. CB01531 TaxID=1718947 RepID=UPI00093E1459|nr:hypothetical protein [Micromonospora sp. CB01531]OKI67842.1 hypothetical protein A6A27_22005 [Micromonospora sp. CB01531]